MMIFSFPALKQCIAETLTLHFVYDRLYSLPFSLHLSDSYYGYFTKEDFWTQSTWQTCTISFIRDFISVPASQMWKFAAFLFWSFLIFSKFVLLVGPNKHFNFLFGFWEIVTEIFRTRQSIGNKNNQMLYLECK